MKYIFPIMLFTMEFACFCVILYQSSGLLWKIFIALCDSVIKLLNGFIKYVEESIKK